MSSVYTVTSFPTKPYEGASYFNVNLRVLGTFRNNQWEYYRPFSLKLPVDSYDIDNDGIPDELDDSVELNYTGGEFKTPSGNLCVPDPSAISSTITSSIQNGTTDDKIFTPGGPGFLLLDDGTIITFLVGSENLDPGLAPEDVLTITCPPGGTIFTCEGFEDSDGDGILDIYDFDTGYTPPGEFEDTGVDISLFLDPIDGGSKNKSGGPYGFYATGDGLVICPEGDFVFFKFGDLVNVNNECTVFFGTLQDDDGNGIPNILDQSIGYVSGDFSVPGSDPLITLTGVLAPESICGPGCGPGSVNNGPYAYTILAEEDGVYYDTSGEVTFFYQGEEVTIQPGSSVFFGELTDSDGDRIPDGFDDSANYINGEDFLTPGSVTVSSVILSEMNDGSVNNSGATYNLQVKESGIIINKDGSFNFFNAEDFIKVQNESTVFFSLPTGLNPPLPLPLDTDGDGTPDVLDKDAGYIGTGPFETVSSVSVDLSLYIENSDSGSLNDSGLSYTKTATKDGVIVGELGSLLFFKEGDLITVENLDTVFLGDLIDQDSDGIPDYFDTSADYAGGIFENSAGVAIEINNYLQDFNTDDGSDNQTGGSYTMICSNSGMKLSLDGSLIIFNKNDKLKVNDNDIVFFGGLLDDDQDGILNIFDTDAGYLGSGDFTNDNGFTIDPSKFLSGCGGGSTNNGGGSYTITAKKDGVIFRADGSKLFFKVGDTITVHEGDTVFFGVLIDENDNCIPDDLETSAEYGGTGEFTNTGGFTLNPGLIIGGCGSGSTNNSGGSYSFIANKDGFVMRLTGEVELFSKGNNVTLHDGDTVFFGVIDGKDLDKDGIPDNLQEPSGYTGQDPFVLPVVYNFIVDSSNDTDYIFTGDISGLDPTIEAGLGDTLVFNNNSIRPLAILDPNGNLVVSEDDGVTSFTSTIEGVYTYRCSTAGFDAMTGTINVSVSNNKTSKILDFLENPGNGFVNKNNFPLVVNQIYPGLLVCADSDPLITLPGPVTIPPGCAFFVCEPENETQSSKLFFSVDDSGTLKLKDTPSVIDGFSFKFLQAIDSETLGLRSQPFISTSDFSDPFNISDEINIKLKEI